jgi:hypothetical protein
MTFQTPGTNVTPRIVFNAGTLDFGSNRLVELDNLSFGVEYSTILLYVLGSIKGQDNVRHSEKVSLSAKVKSFSAEADQLAYGTTVSGSPMTVTVMDGQPSLTNPVLTLTDRNGKEIQYQLFNAIFKSSKVTVKAEDYAEFDLELEASDIQLLYTA